MKLPVSLNAAESTALAACGQFVVGDLSFVYSEAIVVTLPQRLCPWHSIPEELSDPSMAGS